MIIAIDGPGAAGKGTLARRLAAHFGFAYLDTGALYRAVGLKTMASGHPPSDEAAATRAALGLRPEDLAHPALRSEEAAAAASRVARIPAVRAALLDFQRSFAARPPDGARGAVLDGRDIGTVVCPHAEIKLFLTASAEARARRRGEELRNQGHAAIDSEVLEDLRARDREDSTRSVAPLAPSEGAIIIDSSHLDADQVFQQALRMIEGRCAAGLGQRALPDMKHEG